MSRKRLARDGTNHHLTVISPPEYTQLTDAQKEKCKLDDVLYVMTEIGRAAHDSIEYSYSYYDIVNSPHIEYIRQCAGITEKRDLHITLGFDDEDVHGVNKGFDTSIETEKRRKSKFIYK